MDNLFKDYNRIHYHADELENNSSTLQLYKITGEIEIQNIDTHEAWNKFVETTQIKKVKKTPSISLINLFRIAAVVTLLIGVGLVFYFNQIPKENLVEIQPIKPTKVTLPDGTIVWAQKGSHLSYHRKFEDGRILNFSGRAYFDVKKDAEKFRINMPSAKITVLGTEFQLNSIDQGAIVHVVTGQVEIIKGQKAIKVNEGYQALLDNKTSELIRNNTSYNESLKNGVMMLENHKLSEVTNILESFFGCTITTTPEIENCRISGKYNLEDTWNVISDVSEILSLSFSFEGKSYHLKGTGCNY